MLHHLRHRWLGLGSVDQVGAVDFGHVEVVGAGELDVVLAENERHAEDGHPSQDSSTASPSRPGRTPPLGDPATPSSGGVLDENLTCQ